jgi:hypothetical protein
MGLVFMCVAFVTYAQPQRHDGTEKVPQQYVKKATHDEYYSDSTFTTLVGEDGIACDGTHTLWGTTSNYRVRCLADCAFGTVNCRCQQNINGTWTGITCPP